MSISVLNTDAGLSGKTIVNSEDGQTVTGLKTFDRDPNPPFAVSANSAMVANLDAEKVGGTALSGLAKLGVANAGNLIFTDATYDIGASGATRPRDIWTSRDINAGRNMIASAAGGIGWLGRSSMVSSADGVITLGNNGVTDFTRLTFGGTTASFPALRRTATGLDVILADNSAYTGLTVGSLAISTGGGSNSGPWLDLGIISPTQITADQDNYAPASFSTSRVLGLSSDAARTITGLAGGAHGRRILLTNTGSQNIVLANQSASSSAGNKFACPGAANFTLNQFDSVELIYLTDTWYVLGF